MVRSAFHKERQAESPGRRDDKLRRQIFQAAIRSFDKFGMRRATMDDIAEEAGVSRQTVYNYFENKRTLIIEVIRDEGRRVHARAIKGLDFELHGRELVVEAEMVALASASRSPYLRTLCNADAINTTADVVSHSERLAEIQQDYWYPILTVLRDRGELVADLDFAEAVEWITFIHFNLLTQPGTFNGDDDATRRMLHRYLTPALVMP